MNYHQAKRNLQIIEREIQLREIEEALEQLVAEGKVIKHPNGNYQWKPSLADTLHARRDRMRGE